MNNLDRCIAQILDKGYCKLSKVFTDREIAKALSLTKDLYEKSSESVSDKRSVMTANDLYLWNLQNKDFYFLQMLFKPKVVFEILMHFLNDPWFKNIPSDHANFILRNYVGRSSDQRLPMHIDSYMPYPGNRIYMMQVAIILEEQNEANGCTVLVPGSHLSDEFATQESMSTAVPILSKPGDVIMWDSRIWHGTKENKTSSSRWSLIATFTRWWIKQMHNLTQTLPQEYYDRLTDNQKAILGYCSIPYRDETLGISMKRGYESLQESVYSYKN